MSEDVHFENGWEKAQREAAGAPVKGTHPAEAPVEAPVEAKPAEGVIVKTIHEIEAELAALAAKVGV